MRPRKLTIKSGDSGGRNLAVVFLEVNEAAGEDEDVPSLDRLRDENVARGDESRLELAVEDEDHLRRTWVHVRGAESSGSVVDPGDGYAKSVESRDT